MSRASTLPMKFTGDVFSSRCASRVSSLPLVSSSPIDSNPTRGRSAPSATRAYDAAHDRELQQVLRPALDVRAGVEQHRRPAARRDRGRQRGTIDAGNHPERGMRGHHRRAGVAGAEERGRLAARHESAATRIDARGLRRSATAGASAMPDDVRRLDDVEAGHGTVSVLGKRVLIAAVARPGSPARRGDAPMPRPRRRRPTARGRRPSRQRRCGSSEVCFRNVTPGHSETAVGRKLTACPGAVGVSVCRRRDGRIGGAIPR